MFTTSTKMSTSKTLSKSTKKSPQHVTKFSTKSIRQKLSTAKLSFSTSPTLLTAVGQQKPTAVTTETSSTTKAYYRLREDTDYYTTKILETERNVRKLIKDIYNTKTSFWLQLGCYYFAPHNCK